MRLSKSRECSLSSSGEKGIPQFQLTELRQVSRSGLPSPSDFWRASEERHECLPIGTVNHTLAPLITSESPDKNSTKQLSYSDFHSYLSKMDRCAKLNMPNTGDIKCQMR